MEDLQAYWKQDEEYVELVADLLENNKLQKLDNITHHHYTTRLAHSLFVSYVSFRIAKRLNLDTRSVARAGLLHDFFLEDREEIKEMASGSHNYVHPKIALKNASQITDLNHIEKDIIVKHMFLTTRCAFPRYKESYVVTAVDKYCAINEVTVPSLAKVSNSINNVLLKLRLA